MIGDILRSQSGRHRGRLRFHRAHHRLLQWPPWVKLGPRKSARHQHEHLGCDTVFRKCIIEPPAHLYDRMVGYLYGAIDVELSLLISIERLRGKVSHCRVVFVSAAIPRGASRRRTADDDPRWWAPASAHGPSHRRCRMGPPPWSLRKPMRMTASWFPILTNRPHTSLPGETMLGLVARLPSELLH